jgi:hypothetical protein
MSRPVLSVEALADWLRTQPGETSYDYCDNGGCLNYRFFKASGLPVSGVGSTVWTDKDGGRHPLPVELDHIAVWEPHTYAAALERAEAILTTGKTSMKDRHARERFRETVILIAGLILGTAIIVGGSLSQVPLP